MRKIKTTAFINYLKKKSVSKKNNFKLTYNEQHGINKRSCIIDINLLISKINPTMKSYQDLLNKNLFRVVVDDNNYFYINLRR